MAAKTKPETNAELANIIKRQEAKIEKLQKTIEEKNEIIREKNKELSKVADKIEQLESVAIKAQTEVQATDERHSEEMTLVLNRLAAIETKLPK